MVKVTVDGKEVDIEEGSTVFQACEAAGIEIPHFCYHPKLSIAGNCRACLVEVSPISKPIASCAYPVSQDMIIKTDTEMVEKARKGVLELLLINHPLDCPVCDQGGECDLQDITLAYGPGKSRFDLYKRIVPDKNMGPLVSTHMTRCIHCTRCVRFLDEVAGTHEIGAFGRGENTEISTYLEHNLTSELSGNIIDICPVGALNNKPYAYQGRVWELEKTDSIDVLDAVGSNIRIDVRGINIMRVLPRQNDDINECWISDKTRFSYDANHNQRLDSPYIRQKGKLRPVSWNDAFSYIKENLKNVNPLEFGALVGDLVDCDAAFMLKEMMRKMQSPHTDCRPADAQIIVNNRTSYIFNTTISGIEESDCILLIGTNPRMEASLINARIRKRFLRGDIHIGALGPKTDLTYDVDNLGEDISILKDILKNKHPFSKKWFKAKKPMLIVGQSTLYRRDSLSIQEVAQQLCKDANAFTEEWNGYNMLHVHGGQVGCLDVGFVPGEGGYNTREMIEQAKKGKLKAIYLLGVDSFGRSSLGNAFVIYQGHHGGKGAENADVVLPGLTYMEKFALYVNTEGRAQMTQKAVQGPGLAKEDWKIIRALSEYLGATLPYYTQEQIHLKLGNICLVFKHIGKVIKNPIEALPAQSYESLSHAPLQPFITNFYMSDVMTQHSKNMANCIAAQKDGEKHV